MTRFLATISLQGVTDETIYDELDRAIVNEDGYPYVTAENDKIYALPPDMYEFESESTAQQMLAVISLICATLEKKHKLQKTLVVVSEVGEMEFANLQELQDEDFQVLN